MTVQTHRARRDERQMFYANGWAVTQTPNGNIEVLRTRYARCELFSP